MTKNRRCYPSTRIDFWHSFYPLSISSDDKSSDYTDVDGITYEGGE